MDSLTQILLGGTVAAAIAPPGHRRAALLAGAALGTLPDLDSIPIALLTDDPVARMTHHRGLTHSLLVLPFVAWAIWAFFRSRGGRVAASPRRWAWAITLALLTHPLLDAFTIYGTQLLWPLPVRPVMWGTMFIIDPMYSLWLLLGFVVAWFARARPLAQRALVAGLAISSAYLAWSVMARELVLRQVQPTLAAAGLADAPRFATPAPFNTLLWRVVAMTPDGYVQGYHSLLADRGPVRLQPHRSETRALAQLADAPAVARLAWFNHGFQQARIEGDALVVSDLRMGEGPNGFSFNFEVANRAGDGWQWLQPPRQRPFQRPDMTVAQLWGRIVHGAGVP